RPRSSRHALYSRCGARRSPAPTEEVSMALMFESTGCTRCGGSGHYSYCQSYGTRCFKCAGKGVTLTKRGAVAQAYFRLLLSKRYIDLEPGDKIRDEGDRKSVV